MVDDVDIVSDLNNENSTDVVLATDDVQELTRKSERVERTEPTEGGVKKPLSLRDQISSALKGEATTPGAASQDGVARNPDGTFAPRQAVAAPEVPNPTDGAPIATPHGIDPNVFHTLPAETQVHLARTMDGIGQREQRIAALDQVEQLIAPRRQAWALNGMTESQALNQLLALSDFAGRDARGFIRYMAENTGVNLAELVQAADPAQQLDPNVAALQNQVRQLESQLTGFNTQQQQAAHNNVVQSVIAFASEQGQDGKPLRPYFDELGNSVLPFISMVKDQNPNWSQSQILQEAYDRACWGTPHVRAKMQAAVGAAGEAERLRQAALKVGSARAASVSVKSGAPATAGASPGDKGSMSLRDTIRASIAATS